MVIENATFYSLEDNLLNCSRGPIGPISSLNKYYQFPPLFHESVYNPSYTHGGSDREDEQGNVFQKSEDSSHLKSSTLMPSSQDVKYSQWQTITEKPKKIENLIASARDLRQALNRRCSGMTNGRTCSFNLHLDHEPSQLWGSGLVDIFYRCIPRRTIETTCSPIQSSSSDAYSSYSRTYKVDFFKVSHSISQICRPLLDFQFKYFPIYCLIQVNMKIKLV